MKIIFVGLSNKINTEPLSSETLSGSLVDEIIKNIKAECIKTNLVDFAPLDSSGKLRYPNKNEEDAGFVNLEKIIKNCDKSLVVCLGDKVFEYLNGKIDNIIKIKHPSYIAVYRRKLKDEYVKESADTINGHIK